MNLKKILKKKRDDELNNIKHLFNLIAIKNFVNSNLSLLTSLASIGGYTLIKGPMDVATLFTSNKLINEVAGPTINIPQYITDLKSLMISLNRIQKFLIVKDIKLKEEESKDKKEEKTKKNFEKKNLNDLAIEYTNCDFGIKIYDDEEEN